MSRFSPRSPTTSSILSLSRYVSRKCATVMPWMAFCMGGSEPTNHTKSPKEKTKFPEFRGLGAFRGLEIKAVAEVELSRLFVTDEEVAGALGEHLALMDQVGAIDDAQRFTDVVIGHDHADAAR